MALAQDGAGGDVGCLGLLDGEFHRPVGDRKAEAPVAVDDGRGRAFLHDLERRARHDVALVHAVDVGRDGDDAVAVVAGEVGEHAALGDEACLLGRGAVGLQELGGDFGELVGFDDDGHGGVLTCIA